MPTKKQRITDDLRRRLAEREWPVGEQIPVLWSLCETYDACGATVRRAQRPLKTEGLLRSEHGRGVYVVAYPSSSATDGRTEAVAAIETVSELLGQAGHMLAHARNLLAGA